MSIFALLKNIYSIPVKEETIIAKVNKTASTRKTLHKPNKDLSESSSLSQEQC